MRVLSTIDDLKNLLKTYRSDNKQIGFVPTMGALHKGHLSLVKESRLNSDITVTSIFVNPTQFNNPNDLKNYPRNTQADLSMLEEMGCDIVFTPSVEEMYPEKDTRIFVFDGIDKVMEGEHRPGHFNGVAQIVSKLFDIVNPDKAFFGLKDFQQLAIIKQMVINQSFNVEIVACPTIREVDGVAMSSRNQLLTSDHRKVAPVIYKALMNSLAMAKNNKPNFIKQQVVNEINKETLLKVEYFDIVDQLTLQSVEQFESENGIIGCIAVWAGNIRLIDNIIYNY